ncbi:Signal transduction histidine kinase [Parapedobacter indicus]|uniref:histidine kinase n=2 Tax=Parapedobacter indicus TaxID=1477437 RepID=A0A1I3SKQ2_9SPHI|nr:signal transduction histidine kinase [Parapedobacter indicus]SFJ59358.1 Signal transduction histidine kinase [Parapedobacter indicus]
MPTRNMQSTESVRRKVIFVFVSCAIALVLAWIISRVAFTEMMDTVDSITIPDPKLERVSRISRDIMRLDQLQRSQAFIGNGTSYKSFSRESAKIQLSLDSLSHSYEGSSIQQARIDSIKTLLRERDNLFKSYVKVREKVVDSHVFSEQLQSLSDILYEPGPDSKVVTTERKRRTTTIAGDTSTVTAVPIDSDDRGFFSRLFGRKKEEQPLPVVEERRMVEEELETVVDTIHATRRDSTLARIDSIVQRFQTLQQQQREQFVDRELQLTVVSNTLISNMLSILHSVENEAMQQMELDNQQAKSVVNDSVWRISAIILAFFIITAIMLYLILGDIRRNNAYRLALEAAKEEAEYHAAAKQRFLANMSHELRTPLQSIIGYSEQLKQEHSVEDAKIDAIYQSSEHLLQIVNEILDYSRITSGKIVLNERPFSVEDLANSVVAVMKTQAQAKGLTLDFNTRILGLGGVIGDAFRIKQILFNLLSNAIKFTDQGKVTLNVSTVVYTEKTELNIVVKDTGKGIPTEDLERIFNDFEQSENANSGVYFGSGLGLSIVKAICESMHGDIRVESKKGYGSVFKVNIPLQTSRTTTPEASLRTNRQPVKPFEGHIWIIDDDRLILGLCKNILSKRHIPYRCFTSPNEVLSTDWDPRVTTVLMDIRMPEMNGMELNRELRKKIGMDGVTIYACTAQVLPEEQEQILAQGFDGLLLKPFKEADLLHLLNIAPSDAASKQTEISLPQFADDEKQASEIIALYTRDTADDIAALRENYKTQNLASVELLLHRLAGRTAQIGADKIAFQLRKMEIDVRSGDIPGETALESIVSQLTDLILQLQIQGTPQEANFG